MLITNKSLKMKTPKKNRREIVPVNSYVIRNVSVRRINKPMSFIVVISFEYHTRTIIIIKLKLNVDTSS